MSKKNSPAAGVNSPALDPDAVYHDLFDRDVSPLRRIIRTAYDGTDRLVSDATALYFDPSDDFTVQSEKDNCDINFILSQYPAEHVFQDPRLLPGAGVEIDLTGLPTYQEAMNVVVQANHAFASLPAEVRERFSNDPGKFLAAWDDPKLEAEMIRLGVRAAPAPADPPLPPPSNSSGGTPEGDA